MVIAETLAVRPAAGDRVHAARAVGHGRRLADARIAPRVATPRAASRISSSTCSSRAPRRGRRRRSRRRSTRSAASSTRSPRRNTPATTSRCSTSTCRSRSICSSDMLHAAGVRAGDIAREQSVILEEIKMVEDAPDDLVHEVFAQQFWPTHPLGRPILGTPETVSSFESDGLREYFSRTYVAPNLLVAAAGQPRARALRDARRARVRAICRAGTSRPRRRAAGGDAGRGVPAEGHRAEPFCLGTPAYHAGARRSARAVRAEHDPRRLDELAAVPAHPRRARPGLRGLQQPDDLQRRRHDHDLCRLRDRQGRRSRRPVARRSCASCATTPVPADELRRAKDHLKGSLMLSLESTSSRMSHLARQDIYFGRHFTLDEMLAAHRARHRPTTCSAWPTDLFQDGASGSDRRRARRSARPIDGRAA